MEQKAYLLTSVAVLGVLIGAGVAVGGYFVGRGFYMARAGERYVTTKGLVERDVKADLAVWTISYTAAGPDLNSANNKLEQDQAAVLAFAMPEFRDLEVSTAPVPEADGAVRG